MGAQTQPDFLQLDWVILRAQLDTLAYWVRTSDLLAIWEEIKPTQYKSYV